MNCILSAFVTLVAITSFVSSNFAAQMLLVASYRNDNITMYDAQSGAPLGTLVPSGTGSLQQPGELLIGPSDDLFVSNFSQNRVFRFNSQTGAFRRAYVLPLAGSPRGIAFGADGRLYVANTTAKSIDRFDTATRAYLGAFASASSAPIGITFGPDGSLYAALASTTRNANDGRVQRFNPLTGASLGAFGPSNFNNPQALTFGPDQNLYLHLQYDHKIVKLNGSTGQLVGTFVNESYPFNPSSGMVFGPDGKVYTGNLTAGASNDGAKIQRNVRGFH